MHRAHSYSSLIERWRAVCRGAGLRLRSFARDGKYPLFYWETPASRHVPAVYLSAGIHGDEAAGPEALVSWAEANLRKLPKLPLLVFPCLNPWGLVNNIRLNAEGLDLNRVFDRDDVPMIVGWKRVMAGRSFTLSLTLHEDYDAQGIYLYEVQRRPPPLGEQLLDAARGVIPIEGRPRVDRYAAQNGVIRRRVPMSRFKKFGWPEAIWLHLHHSERTFTVETPSEFALEQRVAALRAVIDRGLSLAGIEA